MLNVKVDVGAVLSYSYSVISSFIFIIIIFLSEFPGNA